MSLRLIIFTVAVIASCNASGIGLIKTVPIVRYAPFYNIPNGVRSIHAVAPAAVAAPTPLLPAPLAAPALPAPVFHAPPPAPVFHAPAPAPVFHAPAPAPVFHAPAPAPVFHAPAPAPVFHAPAPAPVFHAPPPAPVFHATAPGPVFQAPAPVLPAPAPLFTQFAPRVAYPAPVFARVVPFAPIVRAVAPAPFIAAGPALPIPRFFPHLHLYNKQAAIAPLLPAPAPLIKQVAWK